MMKLMKRQNIFKNIYNAQNLSFTLHIIYNIIFLIHF